MTRDETRRRRDQETEWRRSSLRTASVRLCVSSSLARGGFSLVELLVVIGLAVLIMALALPAFNFITGSRSVDGATNIVSAFIGRARAEALDRGKITGVMFYIDLASQRRGMILVTETTPKYGPAPTSAPLDNGNIDVFLDLLPEREPILLPAGIDLQVIDNGSTTPGTPPQLAAPYWDRYLGFNTAVAPTDNPAGNLAARVQYGGVILFDGAGKLVSLRYGFRSSTGTAVATNTLTQMGLFLTRPADPANPSATPDVMPRPRNNNPDQFIRSQLGLVLFEQQLFQTAGGSLADHEISQPAITVPAESDEEFWLDANATPLLINRYNGTLVRGQ